MSVGCTGGGSGDTPIPGSFLWAYRGIVSLATWDALALRAGRAHPCHGALQLSAPPARVSAHRDRRHRLPHPDQPPRIRDGMRRPASTGKRNTARVSIPATTRRSVTPGFRRMGPPTMTRRHAATGTWCRGRTGRASCWRAARSPGENARNRCFCWRAISPQPTAHRSSGGLTIPQSHITWQLTH
jgi:hypothetical protein